MNPKSLPIYDVEIELLQALAGQTRAVVQAPTGSGKSTQVPQILLDREQVKSGEIVVLQPRRIAARMLAKRVAEERRVKLGSEVGYQVRFESRVSNRTRIRYVTEGILLRQLLSDPELCGTEAVIFDEFHERHLFGDITLARVLMLQRTARPDLKILVMSATLDVGPLEEYLAPCEVVQATGRTFPVDVRFAPQRVDFTRTPVWEAAANAFQSSAAAVEGDVLVFMPGAFEIRKTIEAIQRKKASKNCSVLPLHGELPADQQDQAVAPTSIRKIIVSTNVAETSLTIEGVRMVIDSGLARIASYDPQRGINTLPIEPISQASADQRAGRAGRTAPGTCVRLWTEHEHARRPVQQLPEVQRLDLAEVALTLKAGGVDDLQSFAWFDPPESQSLERAIELLADLDALDEQGGITPIGRRMLSFPVHPRYARMLLAADELGCVQQAALAAALTQGRDILVRNPGRDALQLRQQTLGESEESDFFNLMRAWIYADRQRYRLEPCKELGIHAGAARQVRPLLENVLRIAQQEGLKINDQPPDDDAMRKCLLAGFSDHLAVRRDKTTLRCALVHRRSALLARESAVQKHPLLVAAEVREIEKPGGKQEVRLNLVTAIEEDWLREMYPDAFRSAEAVRYDPSVKRVINECRRTFRDLVLETRVERDVPKDEAARVLADEVEAGNLPLPGWDASVDQWIARINCLSAWRPDWEVPAIGPDDRRLLLEQVCLGCFSKKDLKNRDVWPAVKTWLSPAQLDLVDRETPTRLMLPAGRRARINYADGAPPELAATIQDLYGLKETPVIAGGRVKLRLQILAPNRRPVQVTEDLASFWRDRYPEVKQELQRRYTKHEWR